MHAVIKTGGKQYRVKKDDVIVVEKLDGDAGASLSFDQVLMLSGDTTEIGAPTVEGAAVAGEIVEQAKGAKVIIFKKRRRKNSRRRNGHRQMLTKVRITDITKAGQSVA